MKHTCRAINFTAFVLLRKCFNHLAEILRQYVSLDLLTNRVESIIFCRFLNESTFVEWVKLKTINSNSNHTNSNNDNNNNNNSSKKYYNNNITGKLVKITNIPISSPPIGLHSEKKSKDGCCCCYDYFFVVFVIIFIIIIVVVDFLLLLMLLLLLLLFLQILLLLLLCLFLFL